MYGSSLLLMLTLSIQDLMLQVINTTNRKIQKTNNDIPLRNSHCSLNLQFPIHLSNLLYIFPNMIKQRMNAKRAKGITIKNGNPISFDNQSIK